jgi:hypothetical protein
MITKLNNKRKSLFSSIRKKVKAKTKVEFKEVKHVDLMDKLTKVEHFEF